MKHYVNTETAVLEMLPSELCQDAALAGTNPGKVPDGTKVFLKNYDKASTLANLALANLLKMMQSYEVPNEKSLVTHITTLANQVAARDQVGPAPERLRAALCARDHLAASARRQPGSGAVAARETLRLSLPHVRTLA